MSVNSSAIASDFAVVLVGISDPGDLLVDEGDSAFACYSIIDGSLLREVNITVTVLPISGESIISFSYVATWMPQRNYEHFQ